MTGDDDGDWVTGAAVILGVGLWLILLVGLTAWLVVLLCRRYCRARISRRPGT
jgi:type IV secretory pathway TrbD component